MSGLGGGTLDVLDVDVPGLTGHRLVIAERIGHVPDGFPRDPAARKRSPW
jgi:hypothetical protein